MGYQSAYDTNAITELAQEKALRETGKRIKGIDEVTRAGVRNRIQEAIDAGMGPREAGEHVAAWSGWDEYRAERIARTETMFAYNSAAITTYGTVGVTHVVADDGDNDAECAARHGGTFSLSEAADIFDHPNGTLDWLPVAPGIDAREVQEELSQVRALSMERFQPTPEYVDPAVEEAAREAARLARAEHIRTASQDKLLRGFDQGEYDLEDVLHHRFGIKGSPNEGIPNVVREPGAPFNRAHERSVIRAIDDMTQKGATYRLDIIRFSNRGKMAEGGGTVAADMGTYQNSPGVLNAAGYRMETREMLTATDAQAITIYRNTGAYIEQYGGYSEYAPRLADELLGPVLRDNDFYNVVTHEMGHAIEKGEAAGRLGFDRAMDLVREVSDPRTRAAYTARLDKELRTTRKYLREQRGFESGMGPVVEGETARMASIRESRRMVIEAFEKQEKELLRMRAEAKELANAFEMVPTRYAGQNAREDFAESVTLYMLKPETLKKYHPARYRLIDRIFKGGA